MIKINERHSIQVNDNDNNNKRYKKKQYMPIAIWEIWV